MCAVLLLAGFACLCFYMGKCSGPLTLNFQISKEKEEVIRTNKLGKYSLGKVLFSASGSICSVILNRISVMN